MKQIKDSCFLNHYFNGIYDISQEQYEQLKTVIEKIFLDRLPNKTLYPSQVDQVFNALQFACSVVLNEYNEYLLKILDRMGVLKG